MSQLKLKHPEFDPQSVKFDTVEVHGGEPRDMYGALIPPIYQTSTFYFDSTDDAVEACADYAESFAYSRITTPPRITWSRSWRRWSTARAPWLTPPAWARCPAPCSPC